MNCWLCPLARGVAAGSEVPLRRFPNCRTVTSVSVHDENTKRDPPAGCLESVARDLEVLGRPGAPSPSVAWEGQWSSGVMETSSARSGLGGDAQYDQGFGEHLEFFSTQDSGAGKRPCVSSSCERSSGLQEHLQPPQGAREGEMFPGPLCKKSLSERVFHLPCVPGGKDIGLGAAPTPCEGLHLVTCPERGHDAAGGTGLPARSGLSGEEQPSAESEENFPPASPCWDHPPDRPEGCPRCRQPLGPQGAPASQQQGQGRGKSYICSDCGKSFVCHSWLVRHRMTHTGERPYKCSECDKSYRRKDYLLNHQRRHSGEGLFQCPLCRKRFVLRRSFVKHQESHVQEAHLTLASWPCAEIRGSPMHSV